MLQSPLKRLVLIACAGLALALTALAAPALSLRPYRPAPVDFELAPPTGAPEVGARSRGFVSRPIRAPARFNLVGLRWSGSGRPAIALRTRREAEDWSPWVAVPSEGHDGPDAHTREAAPGGFSSPVWVGEADLVQYRLSDPAPGLRLHFVNTTGTATPADRARTAVRRLANRATLAVARIATARAQDGAPPIVPRADWGAEDCPPREGPAYGDVKAAFVHHTVTTNDYSREQAPAAVLAICRYHRNSNRWNDIGYNFVVDRYGTIYEGRAGGVDRPVVGAQAQGYNSESTGIANLGTHSDVAQGEAALDAMARLIRWKLPLHGQPTVGRATLTSAGGDVNRHPRGTQVEVERISGHRDVDRTECPGQALHDQLPELRRRVGNVGSRLPRTRMDSRVAPTRVRFPGSVRVSGRLRLLRGDGVGGANVEIQELGTRGWRTFARTRTDDQGAFTAVVAPTRNRLLRTSFAGDGRALPSTSARASVQVRPQLVLSRSVRRARTGQTPVVSGRIAPPKSRVVVVVQRQVGARTSRVARFSVRARGGRFRKAYRLRAPGLHRFYAVFPGDRSNSPATSEAIHVRASRSTGGVSGRR